MGQFPPQFIKLILFSCVWLFFAQVHAQSRATLTLSSPILTVGENGIVEARLDCGEEICSAFSVSLLYDPTLIVVNALMLGDYLGEQALVVEQTIDNTEGELRYAVTALGSSATNPNSDLLFAIEIAGLDSGQMRFNVSAIDIGDLQPLTASVRGGIVQIQETIAFTTSPASARTLRPPTLAPMVSSPAVQVSQPSSLQDGLRYPSIWAELDLQDLTNPATATYELTVDANQTYRWVFTWCSSNGVRLTEILAPLSVEMQINDSPVTNILEYSVPNCHGWMALLSGWQSGQTVTLDIVYRLSEPIFDGQKTYAAGGYVQQILATAR